MDRKYKRSSNWTHREKETLRQLVAQSADIIENKSTKTDVNYQKARAWKNVVSKMNEITGETRSLHQIRLAWKRMKRTAKTNMSQDITCTNDKPKSLSEVDGEMSETSYSFVDYDSDRVLKIEETSPKTNCEFVSIIDSEENISKSTEDPIPDRISRKTTKNPSKKIDNIKQKIMQSNVSFKKRQLEMLEIEHNYNIIIAKLKIRKLELEIGILDNKDK